MDSYRQLHQGIIDYKSYFSLYLKKSICIELHLQLLVVSNNLGAVHITVIVTNRLFSVFFYFGRESVICCILSMFNWASVTKPFIAICAMIGANRRFVL